MRNPTFNITVNDWGSKGSLRSSKMTVRVSGDPRLVIFYGDAEWQWLDDSCLRNHGTNASWTQALHDSLAGMHTCVLHTGDSVAILPSHDDYARVRQLVEDVDNGLTVPTVPSSANNLVDG